MLEISQEKRPDFLTLDKALSENSVLAGKRIS